MNELLEWLQGRAPFSDIPTINVVDEGPTTVHGYLPGTNLRAGVIAEDTPQGLPMALRALVDVQRLDVTPEALLRLTPGERITVCGHPGVRYSSRSDRLIYVLRRGPDIEIGSVAGESIEDALATAQSAVVFVPEGARYGQA